VIVFLSDGIVSCIKRVTSRKNSGEHKLEQNPDKNNLRNNNDDDNNNNNNK
jgi:hypothetical protein